jgi:3-phosphoshikimate 1-carboxyvinyltransferase
VKGTALHSATTPLTGTRRVPGDKPISHRAAILAAIAPGRSTIRGYPRGDDCAATLEVLSRLGVSSRREGEILSVEGSAREDLQPPEGPLHCRRSGTTMRLMAGLLAGAPFHATLTGDEQLLARPMERLAEPLRRMGASVNVGPNGGGPITVRGGSLNGVRYAPPVASAQLKSALLLAGLEASGRTTLVEAMPTRDHTERLLRTMGVPVNVVQTKNGTEVSLSRSTPAPLELHVPGDFSSAAVLIAAGCLVPGSDLRVEDVGLNPTRTGFLRVLERMGAEVEIEVRHEEPEPRGIVRI